MARFVGLDVSQKLTAICVVDDTGLGSGGQCSDPSRLRGVRGQAGEDARSAIETGPMTPWLVHELRGRGLNVVCLDARHARAALKMQMNKTDQNDAEGFGADHAHGLVSACAREVARCSPCARLGWRPGAARGHDDAIVEPHPGCAQDVRDVAGRDAGPPFDRRVEELLADRDDLALIVRPMLAAWRQLREQIAAFDKEVRALAKKDPTCRLLMSVPGIGVLSVLAYVSTVEDPRRFARSRSVGAHMGLTPRQYQSGEVDRSGRISRCGDTLARTLLAAAQRCSRKGDPTQGQIAPPQGTSAALEPPALPSGHSASLAALAGKPAPGRLWRAARPVRRLVPKPPPHSYRCASSLAATIFSAISSPGCRRLARSRSVAAAVPCARPCRGRAA